MQPLSGVHVGAVGDDDQLIVRGQILQRDARVRIDLGWVKWEPVEGDGADSRCDEVDEGGGTRCGREPRRGGGSEDRLAAREIEDDVIALGPYGCAALGGLKTSQVLTGHKNSCLRGMRGPSGRAGRLSHLLIDTGSA